MSEKIVYAGRYPKPMPTGALNGPLVSRQTGEDFSSRIELSVRVDSRTVDTTVTELRQNLKELGVDGGFDIEQHKQTSR